jgi:hypothetical protein
MLENAYGLILGISTYQYVNSLPPTVTADASTIYEVLTDPERCGYPPLNVQLLLDSQATLSALHQGLARLSRIAGPDAQVLIYFSGHGAQLESGSGRGEYLLPVDAKVDTAQAIMATAFSGKALTNALRAIPARKVLVIFDCCHAGGLGQPKDAAGAALKTGLPERLYDALKSGIGRAIISSSRSSEVSWVMPGDDNSLFTKHLLAGLRGGVVSADGLIRVFDLFEYLQPRVTIQQASQHPVFKADLEENFPVAMYLGGQKGAIPTDVEGYRYAAYISYVDKEPDNNWVWQTLLPRIEAAGLTVAVSSDVEEPGVARVVGTERAMKQSKRTVIVLSPAYLANSVKEFESVMGMTMGLEERSYRLLPVKIASVDDCEVPTRLSQLVTLDLTHPTRTERDFTRLINALKGPLPRM